MKYHIRMLAAVLIISSATAGETSRMVTNGRAGYSVAPRTEWQAAAMDNAVIVALTLEKTEPSPTRIQTSGRAGYTAVPNRKYNSTYNSTHNTTYDSNRNYGYSYNR